VSDPAAPRPFKIPRSVLVVIHTPALEVLVIERADRAGFWQSVTGSLDRLDEDPAVAARREVEEETGIGPDTGMLSDWHHAIEYEIYATWRHRYAPGTTRNTEHWFALEVPAGTPVRLSPREHVAHAWLPWQEAAARCFSPSNGEAIRQLPVRQAAARGG
jgi:dATP pyrophosphohydrolase